MVVVVVVVVVVVGGGGAGGGCCSVQRHAAVVKRKMHRHGAAELRDIICHDGDEVMLKRCPQMSVN